MAGIGSGLMGGQLNYLEMLRKQEQDFHQYMRAMQNGPMRNRIDLKEYNYTPPVQKNKKLLLIGE